MPGTHPIDIRPLLVVSAAEFDPPRDGASAGSPGVGAMDAGAAGTVDVELSMDGHGVTPVGGHPGRQGRVVIHLQLIALGVGDRQVLVSPGLDRVGANRGVEGHFGA
jgi:hypothetical protein